MQDNIEELRDVEVLSPDEIWDYLDRVELEEDIPEPEPEPVYIKPTGEGLTKRQAHKLLIEEMNKIKQVRNAKALYNYREAVEDYYNAVRAEEPTGAFPTEPTYTPVFSDRAINHAVQMARHLTGWDELITVCGF